MGPRLRIQAIHRIAGAHNGHVRGQRVLSRPDGGYSQAHVVTVEGDAKGGGWAVCRGIQATLRRAEGWNWSLGVNRPESNLPFSHTQRLGGCFHRNTKYIKGNIVIMTQIICKPTNSRLGKNDYLLS